MLKMSYAGCPRQSPAISMQFTLNMSDSARNRQKNSLKTNKKSVTTTCYDEQHVCAYLQPFSR